MDPRAYGNQLINAQTQRATSQGDAIMQRQLPRFGGPQQSDVLGAYAAPEIQRIQSAPNNYRSVRFIANSKYSHESTQSTSSMTWTLADRGNARGSINARTDVIDSVVGVELRPFYVPSSMFTTGDLSWSTMQVYFGAISNPEFVSYDYRGYINDVAAIPYHFDCTVSSDIGNTRLITPIVDRIVFSSPVALVDNTWRVSLISPLRQLTIPAVVLTATTLVASNPMALTVTGHGLTTGDKITIDTGVYAQYTTGSVAYAITVVDANTITVTGVDSRVTATAAAIPTTTTLIITALPRVIRMPITLICNDRRANGPTSIGANLLV